MLKVLIWDYHNDYHQKKYWKMFSDFEHLEDWLFDNMNTRYDNCMTHSSGSVSYAMNFREPNEWNKSGTIEINPEGIPTDHEIKIEQIENERGILFESGKYCSNRIVIFIQTCLRRRDKKKEYVDEAV